MDGVFVFLPIQSICQISEKIDYLFFTLYLCVLQNEFEITDGEFNKFGLLYFYSQMDFIHAI